jgi:hypothetical protein
MLIARLGLYKMPFIHHNCDHNNSLLDNTRLVTHNCYKTKVLNADLIRKWKGFVIPNNVGTPADRVIKWRRNGAPLLKRFCLCAFATKYRIISLSLCGT